MTDTPTPRRRRRIVSEPDTPQPAPAPIAIASDRGPAVAVTGPQAALETFLAYLRDIERMRQYRLIGRLSRAQILRPEGAKTLDFRKDGPVLAFANGTEQLIVADTWRGLPPKWDDTDQFCQACLSNCDVCGATGKKACEAQGCGGGGQGPVPAVVCPAEDCLDHGKPGKHIKPGCEMCHGTGSYIGKKACPVCEGSGRAQCSLCRGSGKRPTGIQGGGTNYREPTCPECRGSKFAHKEIPQEFNSFVNARIGPMIALGPIMRFVVESVGGEGLPPQVYDVEADANGQHLAILLEHEQPGSRVYMIGGVLRARTR